MRDLSRFRHLAAHPWRLAAASLITLAVLAGSPAVRADDDQAEDAQEKAALAEAKLTIPQAIEAAMKEFPGAKVLEAQVDTENGVPSYVIDVEKDGVHRLLFDIKTGAMSKAPPEEDNRDDGEDEDEEENDD